MHWTETFFTNLYAKIGLEQKIVFGEVEAALIKRNLGLRKGQKVLDLCCGIGRHAVPLAAMGLQVTGMDITESYLKRARNRARKQGIKAKFQKGDMRTLDRSAEFHAVLNLFTSFGYYDDKTNQQVLQNIYRALRPKGKFLLDVMNRDFLVRNYQNCMTFQIQDKTVLNQHEWNPRNSRIKSTWQIIQKRKIEEMGSFDLRLYSLHEISAMIEQTGMQVLYEFGGMDFSPFNMHSHRLVLMARKPADEP